MRRSKKEPGDDDDEKEMCEMQFNEAGDYLKILDTTISDLEKEIDNTKEFIATLTDEVALKNGLVKAGEEVIFLTTQKASSNPCIGTKTTQPFVSSPTRVQLVHHSQFLSLAFVFAYDLHVL